MQKCFRTFIILSLFILLAISCDKNNDLNPKYTDTIIGCWTNPQLNDTIWTYDKTNKLPENGYGFEFKSDNIFIERKNSGCCATPPIAYADFEGTWSQKDSLVTINVDFWGGTMDYQWKIISVDKDYLKIYEIKEEKLNDEPIPNN